MKKTQSLRLLLFVATFAFAGALSVPLFAQSDATLEQRIKKVMDRPEFAHSRFGIKFYSMDSGKVVYELNSQQLFVPGSTTKLLTEGTALELLGAAYAVHPAFAEARIVEFGSGLRPAFPDNLPRIAIDKQRISVNGLYRHGFLLAPALAELTLGYVARGVIDNEVMQCA